MWRICDISSEHPDPILGPKQEAGLAVGMYGQATPMTLEVTEFLPAFISFFVILYVHCSASDQRNRGTTRVAADRGGEGPVKQTLTSIFFSFLNTWYHLCAPLSKSPERHNLELVVE